MACVFLQNYLKAIGADNFGFDDENIGLDDENIGLDYKNIAFVDENIGLVYEKNGFGFVDENPPLTENRKDFLHEESFVLPKPVLRFNDFELETLKPTNWLSDAIVNSYLSYMLSKSTEKIGCTNSFFYAKLAGSGPQASLNWAGFKEKPINHYDKFLIPICAGCHWILAVCDFKCKQLQILDSLGSRYSEVGNNINNFLGLLGIGSLTVTYPNVPHQMNSNDCGVFLLSNARCIFFNNGHFDFSQKDIPNMRLKIRNDLIQAKQMEFL